jgi:pantothenate kinase
MISHSNENIIMDDANSPEINQKLMGKVASDFVKVFEHLKEASYQIRKRNFSQFPIFIVTDKDIEMGVTLFKKGEFETVYEYKASYFEEFTARQMIGEESVEFFIENYKDSEEYCCLFVIDEGFAGFIYLPFPND